MAVESISNLVPSIPDQVSGQAQTPQPVPNTLRIGNAASPAVGEDSYTPSALNRFPPASAQDAGIFQVNQGAPTAGPPVNQLAQTNINAVQGGPTAQAAVATAANSVNQQSPAQATAAAKNTTETGATLATQTTPNPAATALAQNQIQALNAALPALGLTNEEIQQIDRIATLAQNFNPAAYASLVSQFESLSQQAAQQGVPTPGAASIQGTENSPTPAVSVNGITYQLQGALIHFSVQPGTQNNGAGNGNGQEQGNTANNGQTNAAGLQFSQAQFVLSNDSGQTVQVQAPQQSTNAGTPDLQAPQIVALAG